MKQTPNLECAAICGLFCGACPAYPKECHGCGSDFLRESCKECHHGFRKCAKTHNVDFCGECKEFPCKRIDKFSKGPIIKGVNNHKHVIRDSELRLNMGSQRWVEMQTAHFLDAETDELKTWYDLEEFQADSDCDN